jgi:biotin-(acetyl-CoA carboxylase) ligase
LTALGAIATAEVVSSWTGQSARIKWPNDVRVKNRKIAGILVESALAPNQALASPRHTPDPAWGAVIGVGLNANLVHEDFPPELAALATSLQIERGGDRVDRSELVRDLIRRLDHWYDLSRANGPETLNAAWCQRSEHLGRLVKVATPSAHLVGRLIDLDVRFGVTLELSSIASVPNQVAARQQSSKLAGPGSPLDRQDNGQRVQELANNAARDCSPPLAKLPLADIRSIEPFDENHAPRTYDPAPPE